MMGIFRRSLLSLKRGDHREVLKVVVSPFTVPPAAISFSIRRMILPLRVLGRPGGEADVIGPRKGADLLGHVGADHLLELHRGLDPVLQGHEADKRLAL